MNIKQKRQDDNNNNINNNDGANDSVFLYLYHIQLSLSGCVSLLFFIYFITLRHASHRHYLLALFLIYHIKEEKAQHMAMRYSRYT